jgi:hypothetical protein
MKRLPFIVGLASLFASLAQAAPVITSISWPVGTQLLNGTTMTINGSGFGATLADIQGYDEFESGTVGQVVATGAGSMTYGPGWSSEGSDGHSHYASSAAVSGTQCLQSDFGTGGFAPMVQRTFPTQQTDLFFDYQLYVPSAEKYPGEGGSGQLNFKHLWVQDTGTADGDIVLPATFNDPPQDWALFQNDGPFQSERYFDIYPTSVKGRWIHFMVHLKWGTSANYSGEVKIWEVSPVSGVQLMVSTTSAATQFVGDTGWNQAQFNAYGRNTVSPSHVCGDNYYIAAGAASQARSYIGNNATFASNTKLAVMTETSRSDTQITAIVRRSDFGASDAVQVIVLDASGNASSGSSVTLGSTYAAAAASAVTNRISGSMTIRGNVTIR